MQKQFSKFMLLGFLLLATIAVGKECLQGQIKIGSKCVDCKTILNTRIDDSTTTLGGSACLCKEGFLWSEVHYQCLPQRISKKSILSSPETRFFSPENIESEKTSRLLATVTCNASKGFILLNSACVNCRVLPFTLGVTFSSTVCSCLPSFQSGASGCSCGSYTYLDPNQQLCLPCKAQPQACIQCSGPVYVYTTFGCVSCAALANNGLSLDTPACCAAGYSFDPILLLCKCDASQGYSIDQSGNCIKCLAQDTNCKNCINNYVYSNFYCIHGAHISNYNYTSTYICNPGYTLKADPATGEIFSCACSAAAQYYQNGTSCIACSATLPDRVSLANCQSCAASAGFYLGSVECIFCPAVQFSFGTATINGCDCQLGYYWNSVTDACECDFTLGYVGGAISKCINCADILFTTSSVALDKACSCQVGYAWNVTSNTCVCDLTSISVFSSGASCINCVGLVGSTGKINGGKNGCVCISSYFWNAGTNKCQCDSTQNFVVLKNGLCTDCKQVPLSNGLALAGGCVCINGYQWSATLFACVCPARSAVVGSICTTCTIANAKNTSIVVAECEACTASKGYTSLNGNCYFSSSVSNSTGFNSTKGVPTCGTGLVWSPFLGACVCDWTQNYVTYASGATFKCVKCPYTWSNNKCACGFALFYLSSSFSNVCSNCQADPNSLLDASGNCICKTGYGWSENSYPFKCVPSAGGSYLNVSVAQTGGAITNTSALCSSLSTPEIQGNCSICNYKQGFLLLPGTNICLFCPSATGATTGDGSATQSGCVCNDTSNWNPITLTCDTTVPKACPQESSPTGKIFNPYTQACDLCDPVYSVKVSGTCYSCANDTLSNTFAVNSSRCACLAGNFWDGAKCAASTDTCDTTTNIVTASGACFACPTASANGPDTATPITGTDGAIATCTCATGYTWIPTLIGGSCQCSLLTSSLLPDGTTCVPCPAAAANGAGFGLATGGCGCINGYSWDNTSACICTATVNSYITTSTLCFQCSTVNDPNILGIAASSTSCTCGNGFIWTASATGGSCTCPAPGFVQNGVCYTCLGDANTQPLPDGNGGCLCNNNYIWSPDLKTCSCSNGTIQGMTVAGKCVLCSKTVDPNFDETLTSGICTCGNSYVYNAAGAPYCQCDFTTNSLVSGACTICTAADKTTAVGDGKGGCKCTNGYGWNGITCACDAASKGYSISSGDCFLCNSENDALFGGLNKNGTACNCINGYVFEPSETGGICACNEPSIVQSNGICYTCPNSVTLNSNGVSDGLGGCQCLNGYVWDYVSLSCICNSQTSVVLNNGTCVACGSAGSSTTVPYNTSTCTCSIASLVWSDATAICECNSSSAAVVSGNTTTCIACTTTIRAIGKLNSFACSCSTGLVWNTVTKQCDCGPNAAYIGGSTCVPCTSKNYALGVNSSRISSCNCAVNMIWNAGMQSCTCSLASSVVFVANGTFTCKSCNKSIFALAQSSPTSCICSSGFTWTDNVGCTCPSGSIPVQNGSSFKCVVCNTDIYSSGPSSSGDRCKCLGTLTWNSVNLSCGCNTTSAISSNNGQYFCSACSTANNAKTPLVNATACNCINSQLFWSSQGFCGCQNPSTQASYLNGSATSCVTCNATINSYGKTSPNSNTCGCVSPVFTFNNGTCDCGAGKAYILIGTSNYQCLNCSNPAAFLKNKSSSSSCACVNTNLTWDNTIGQCRCSDANQVIIGGITAPKCVACSGQYVSGTAKALKNGTATCGCFGTGLVFTLTSNATSKTSGTCSCAKNSILLPSFLCLACPGTNTNSTPFECGCPAGSIWNGWTLTCQACSSITKALAAGGTSLACKCNGTFVWDVMTLTCVAPCTSNSASCMNCNFAAFSQSTGAAATLNTATSATLAGSATVIPLVNGTYTNYNSIKKYKCACATGFTWDAVRLRCYAATLFPAV